MSELPILYIHSTCQTYLESGAWTPMCVSPIFPDPVAEGVKIHTSFSPFMIGHMFWGTKGEFKTRSKTDLPHKISPLILLSENFLLV